MKCDLSIQHNIHYTKYSKCYVKYNTCFVLFGLKEFFENIF